MILVIGMLFLGWYLSYSTTDPEPEFETAVSQDVTTDVDGYYNETSGASVSTIDSTYIEDPIASINNDTQESLELSLISGPTFNNIKRVYNIEVLVENAEGAAFKYEVCDHNGNPVKTESNSKMTLDQSEYGVYYVRAINENSGQSTDLLLVSGCEPKKMSPERLLEICSSGDYTTMENSEAYQFNPELELAFNGVDQDIWAHSISEICTRISLEIWSSVSISRIEYDDNYRISRVEFDVQLP